MRKHFLLIALAGLTVLAACNKQKESQGVAQFTATIEHHGGRTSLDPNNGQINWMAGDRIVIANDNNETAVFTLQSGEGTTEGGFGTTDEFNTVGPFIAAYPSDAIIENDKVTYNLPAIQTIGESGTFANGANPMVACSDDKNLQFKNLCGGLGIRLKGVGARVSAVRITSKNTAEKLWGTYEVSNCASNEPTLTEASNNQGTNIITLHCNVTLTTAAKTFFVMLPPGTLANGFTMEVLDGDEVLATKETDSDVAFVERNNVKVFNEILIDVEFDGNVEIPTGMTGADIIVTNLGEDAMPDENGDFFIGYSKMLTAKNATNNEIIYMSVLSVDYDIAKGENQLQSYVLNAKETALYYALTMIPFGLNQAKDETFQSIKDVLYDLDCVQALETAIAQSVNQNGYLRAVDIGDELNTVWNYLRDELLAPFLEMQSSNSGGNMGHIVLKKDGTLRLEQPQIQNNGRYSGIRLDVESANFNESSNTWTLNLTGYSDNGVFIGMNKGSIVDGQAHPTGGRTPYFIPPMNVGKFMGTFTSLGGLKDYFVDTWRLITEDDFWFDDMTWDKAKLQNITFELGSNENALLMYSPKDDRPTAVVNVVYFIMQPVGIVLDAILTQRGYSEFFTSLLADQELCATIAGVVGHPENFTTAANALLGWAVDLFATEAFRQYINPKYNVDKILEKIVSSSARAAIEYVGNGLGTLASWYLFDSFAFTVEAEYNNEPVVLPTLTTDSYEVLSSTQAMVTGTLVNAGTYSIAERGICYGTSYNPTLNDFYVPAEGTGTGAFTCTLDLQPNTVYYARAYAKNWLEMVGYGHTVSFNTGNRPTVTTHEVLPANIGRTTATVTGSVVFPDPIQPVEFGRGFVLGESPNGLTVNSENEVVQYNGTELLNYSYTFTDLLPETPYYVRAYSYAEGNEVVYGEVVSFTTLPNSSTFTITTMTYPVNSGLTSGDGTYNQGQSCTVTATAITGYTFVCWMEGSDVVSTDASYTFTVNGNRTLVANFSVSGGGGQAPTGAINGLFTINANGDQVYFSQGNLQYIGSAGNGDENNTGAYWKFAEHQWDYLGNNGQSSDSKTVDRDLFGWGTSGYNHGANAYQPWNTNYSYGDYNAYGNWQYNLCDQTGQADWGYNAINNGGNAENSGWRTLTSPEWDYVFDTRSTTSGIRWVKGTVNGINGIILLPDNWATSIYSLNNTNGGNYGSNTISAADWVNVLEANGAVFLPAAGHRINGWTPVASVGSTGFYWSASSCGHGLACYVNFGSDGLTPSFCQSRYQGIIVRLVRNAQ